MDLTSSYIRAVKSLDQIDIAVLVNNIILDAVHDKASDIHIEPWESTLPIRLRISGILRELTHLPHEFLDRIAGRLKVMADLVTYETEMPQEGRVPASAEFGNVELRVSIFPTVRGEKIVIRLFDPQNRNFNLETLGFEPDTLEQFKKLIQQPSGLILLNGPTGSGKTTAIYSALCHLVETHGPTISISTVEDPVEFNLPMISQSQISNSRGFTYPMALRSLMRQDPEAIMIGEIRDPETAAIAVQAGLTGHMIFSTIHSDSTVGGFCPAHQYGYRAVSAGLQYHGGAWLALVAHHLSPMQNPIPAQPRAPFPASRRLSRKRMNSTPAPAVTPVPRPAISAGWRQLSC